jgi:hypothetical protein
LKVADPWGDRAQDGFGASFCTPFRTVLSASGDCLLTSTYMDILYTKLLYAHKHRKCWEKFLDTQETQKLADMEGEERLTERNLFYKYF